MARKMSRCQVDKVFSLNIYPKNNNDKNNTNYPKNINYKNTSKWGNLFYVCQHEGSGASRTDSYCVI